MDEKLESEEKQKPKIAVKSYKVTIIKSSGGEKTALVEWVQDEQPHRGFIPSSKIGKDNLVEEPVLNASTQYGVPWEDIKITQVTSEDIANSLRKAGIWTAEDLRTHQQVALGAIQAAYRVTLASCNQAAKQFQMEGDV